LIAGGLDDGVGGFFVRGTRVCVGRRLIGGGSRGRFLWITEKYCYRDGDYEGDCNPDVFSCHIIITTDGCKRFPLSVFGFALLSGESTMPAVPKQKVKFSGRVRPEKWGRFFEILFFPMQLILFIIPGSVRAKKYHCLDCGYKWKLSVWSGLEERI